jgi:hypothetical protein
MYVLVEAHEGHEGHGELGPLRYFEIKHLVTFCSFRRRTKDLLMMMSQHSNRFILPKAGPLKWTVQSAEVTIPESK